MAQFSGKQYKGAMRDRKALKREEAEARQAKARAVGAKFEAEAKLTDITRETR